MNQFSATFLIALYFIVKKSKRALGESICRDLWRQSSSRGADMLQDLPYISMIETKVCLVDRETGGNNAKAPRALDFNILLLVARREKYWTLLGLPV